MPLDIELERDIALNAGWPNNGISIVGVGEAGCGVLREMAQRGLAIPNYYAVVSEKTESGKRAGLPAHTQFLPKEKLLQENGVLNALSTGQPALIKLAESRLIILLADIEERDVGEAIWQLANYARKKQQHIHIFAIVPEGYSNWPRTEKIRKTLEDLRHVANSIFVVAGRPLNAGKSVEAAYRKKAQEHICHTLAHLLLLTQKTSLSNLSVSDICRTLEYGQFGCCANGQASGESQIPLAINKALQGLPLPGGLAEAACVILCVSAPPGMPMEQVEKAVYLIRELCRRDVSPAIGIRLGDSLDDQFRLTLLAAGVEHIPSERGINQWP